MRHRLLDVDVLPRADRLDDHAPVPVVGNGRDDAVDVLVVEQSAVLTRRGQIGPHDLLGERVAAVVQVGRGGAGHARQLDRGAEQTRALHADTDHTEAHGVARSDAAKLERLCSERDARGGCAELEKFAARPSGFLHGGSP